MVITEHPLTRALTLVPCLAQRRALAAEPASACFKFWRNVNKFFLTRHQQPATTDFFPASNLHVLFNGPKDLLLKTRRQRILKKP